MNKIEINTLDQKFNIGWSDIELFKKYLLRQRALLDLSELSLSPHRLQFKPTDNLIENANIFYQNYWDLLYHFGVYDNLPMNPTVVDIGSGMGIIDFLAYQYLNNQGKFYLIDHEEFIPPKVTYSENYTHYHSWKICDDIINTTKLNADNFIFVDSAKWRYNIWPDNIDLITAWGSWCWHFPRSIYWDKVKSRLKVGGKLVIEVSQPPVRPVTAAETTEQLIDSISEEFQSTPKIYQMSPNGLRVMWIKNR